MPHDSTKGPHQRTFSSDDTQLPDILVQKILVNVHGCARLNKAVSNRSLAFLLHALSVGDAATRPMKPPEEQCENAAKNEDVDPDRESVSGLAFGCERWTGEVKIMIANTLKKKLSKILEPPGTLDSSYDSLTEFDEFSLKTGSSRNFTERSLATRD